MKKMKTLNKDYKKEYKELIRYKEKDDGSFEFWIGPEGNWNFIESMVSEILASVELERIRSIVDVPEEIVLEENHANIYNQAVTEQHKRHKEVLE